MDETPHNRPVERSKLSAALKRNMARRKAVSQLKEKAAGQDSGEEKSA